MGGGWRLGGEGSAPVCLSTLLIIQFDCYIDQFKKAIHILFSGADSEGGRGVQSNPLLVQNVIFIGSFG